MSRSQAFETGVTGMEQAMQPSDVCETAPQMSIGDTASQESRLYTSTGCRILKDVRARRPEDLEEPAPQDNSTGAVDQPFCGDPVPWITRLEEVEDDCRSRRESTLREKPPSFIVDHSKRNTARRIRDIGDTFIEVGERLR